MVAINAEKQTGPPEASHIPLTAPAGRLAAEGVRGRPDSTAGARVVSIKSRLNESGAAEPEGTDGPCRPVPVTQKVATDVESTGVFQRGFYVPFGNQQFCINRIDFGYF